MTAQLGINIVSSRRDPAWTEQLRRLEIAKPDVLKVQMPVGFGTSTADVAAALDRIPSIKTVILRGQDCEVGYAKTRDDLFGPRVDFDGPLGSWMDLIRSRPGITFWIEIGNEPENCGLPVDEYRTQSLNTVQRLQADLLDRQLDLPNLHWTISLPVEPANARFMFDHGDYEALCDGIATHLYAVHDLDHPVPNWREIYDWLLANTSLPILITEAGVNDVTQTTTQLAAHYVDYLKRQPARIYSLTLFGSVSDDLKWEPWHLDDAALRTLTGRLKDPGAPAPPGEPAGTTIFGPSQSTPAEVRQWAIEVRKAHQRFLDVIPIYFELAPLYNIPAERALAQAAKETDDGHFTGVVPASYHNWCGLKTKTANGDRPEDHQQFATDREGVEAHLQHLARYGGATALPPGRVMLDPRWHFVTQFTDTFEGLGGPGSWAPSPTYGIEVVAIIRTIPIEGTGPMDLTATILARISARGVEVHDIRDKMIWHKTLKYQRLPNSAWVYTAVHHTGSDRTDGSLDSEIGSWISHSRYHTQKDPERNKGEWPGIAYAIGGSQSGRIFALRDVELMGYHAFNANNSALAICGDIGGEPSAALLASFEIVLDVLHTECPELSSLKGPAGTYGHQEFTFIDPRAASGCPGELMDFVREYRSTPAGDPNARYFEETGHWVVNLPGVGMYDLWKRLGGIAAEGYPLGGMTQRESGVHEQLFENSLLEIYADGAGRRGGLGQRYKALLEQAQQPAGVDPEIVLSSLDGLDAIVKSLREGLPS